VEAAVRALIDRFKLRPLPIEGTLYAETYRSAAGTAMIGLYSIEPPSRSCFHRLTHDEVWHAYAGDPFRLVLLSPGGGSAEVVMGRDVAAGQHVQYTVPAGTWQAGELLPGGRYALFGCTVAPGFTPECFEAGPAEPLLAGWPARADDIRRLAVRE
jgi:predicted cupin superfamily sugar epimerase